MDIARLLGVASKGPVAVVVAMVGGRPQRWPAHLSNRCRRILAETRLWTAVHHNHQAVDRPLLRTYRLPHRPTMAEDSDEKPRREDYCCPAFMHHQLFVYSLNAKTTLSDTTRRIMMLYGQPTTFSEARRQDACHVCFQHLHQWRENF